MPIPGHSTTYDLVDWLKARKYHIEEFQQVLITGLPGGLIRVEVSPSKEDK